MNSRNEIPSRAVTEAELHVKLRNEENRIRALSPAKRTEEEQKIIDDIDDYLSQLDSDAVDHNAVPSPYQFPPNTSGLLPTEYTYATEVHLNWQRVVTYNKSTKEICGIAETVKQQLVVPTLSLCRDGNCRREECQPHNFHILASRNQDLIKWINEEKQRTTSHSLFGKKAIITEDEYGYFIDGIHTVDGS